MQRTRRLALVVPVAIAALVLSACGSGGGGNTPQASSGPPGSSGGTAGFADVAVKQGGTMNANIEKDFTDFNLNTSEGFSFDQAQVLNAVYPTVYQVDPALKIYLNTDMMVSAELTSQSPETIVYKIKPEAKWSDGVDINADDFVYAWTTSNGKGKYTPQATTGYEDIASVTGSDGGKTVTVTFAPGKTYPDWKGLFPNLLPAHYMKTLNPDPVKAFNEGLKAPKFPTITGGPYVITDFKPNTSVTLKRNDAYYGNKKAPLDTLTWRITTDANAEVTALQNGELNYIYPQPQVDLVQNVKKIQGVKTDIGFGLVFEHLDFNVASVKDPALRQAMFTAVNRDNILNATVKQFSDKSQTLNNRMLVPGQDGYQDNTNGIGQGNLDAAKKILTDAGYTGVGTALKDKGSQAVPALRFRYTEGNMIRQQTGELFKADMKQLGIDVTIQSTPKLGKTLDSHDFDVIVFAWVGTPFPYSANKSIYVTKGGQNYDSYSNPDVDAALTDAASQLDAKKAQDDLNKADLQVSKDAVTLPLYQKATFLAYQDKYGNIHNNSTSVGPTYNVGSWGLL